MYTIEGKNIKDRVDEGKTMFFLDKKDAIEQAERLRSYYYEVFNRREETEEEAEMREAYNRKYGTNKRKPTVRLIGWAVPK